MRTWLTPRFILIVLMLVVAPSAALAHLLISWAPGKVAVARLNRQVSQCKQQLDAECAQATELRQKIEQLQQNQTANSATSDSGWLPQRDQDGVFDALADVFRDPRVVLEQLILDDPALYAAASRRNLLACEQVTIQCLGSYETLCAGLDHVAALELPIRCTGLTWIQMGDQLALTVQLQVPFVPDDALRTALADAAGLEEDDEP